MVALPDTDVRSALRGIGKSELARLLRIAQRYALGLPLTPEDLLHEAVLRTLAGTRICKDSTEVVRFLVGAMHSIAFDERKKTKTHALDAAASLDDEDDHGSAPAVDDDAHTIIVERENEERLSLLRRLVQNNENAALVLEGLLDGMTAAEIRVDLGLTPTAYDSARTYIHRRLDAHFGKRPKP